MLTIEEKETSQDNIRQIKRKTRVLLRSHGHIGGISLTINTMIKI